MFWRESILRNLINRFRKYQNDSESAQLLQNIQKIFFTELPQEPKMANSLKDYYRPFLSNV